MTEDELLRHVYARSTGPSRAVEIGPGDDCALVVGPGGDRTLLTVDQLVEHRHFTPETPIDLIARKAVGRSVSDIAAMGGRPAWGLATGLLPAGYPSGDALFEAMASWADRWGCSLVGGDIAMHDGPLVLTVTVGGVPGDRLLTRAGASVGDGVYITGRVGGSFASGRHLAIEPRVEVGAALATGGFGVELGVGACLDVSDGVGRDAGRLAEASGVGIEIIAEELPLHDGVGWQGGIGDGEDYELLFTARERMPKDVAGVAITRIGRVVEARGCWVVSPSGERLDASSMGWDHDG